MGELPDILEVSNCCWYLPQGNEMGTLHCQLIRFHILFFSSPLAYSMMIYIFSGQKTAQDLYLCMMKNVCEKIPEHGYGYTEVKQHCPTCPSCSQTSDNLWLSQNIV